MCTGCAVAASGELVERAGAREGEPTVKQRRLCAHAAPGAQLDIITSTAGPWGAMCACSSKEVLIAIRVGRVELNRRGGGGASLAAVLGVVLVADGGPPVRSVPSSFGKGHN